MFLKGSLDFLTEQSIHIFRNGLHSDKNYKNVLSLCFSIKPIPPALLSLPIQSTKVHICGLKPKKGVEGKKLRDSDWTIETMKEFYNMVANKRLIAEIVVRFLSIYT